MTGDDFLRQTEVSRATLGRIPIYLKYLKSIEDESQNISATAIARELGLGEVQVRKDLGTVSGVGRPKTGYKVSELIYSLEKFLGADKTENVVIVGAGKLGKALLGYKGFEDYGLHIIAAFDKIIKSPVTENGEKTIYPMDNFPLFCKQNNVKIGIITVPAESAQEVCDLFVKNGIKAIWNFAPCSLSVPEGINIQYENMALSLAYLNKKV